MEHSDMVVSLLLAKLPERAGKAAAVPAQRPHSRLLSAAMTPRTVSGGRGPSQAVPKEACVMTPWRSG